MCFFIIMLHGIWYSNSQKVAYRKNASILYHGLFQFRHKHSVILIISISTLTMYLVSKTLASPSRLGLGHSIASPHLWNSDAAWSCWDPWVPSEESTSWIVALGWAWREEINMKVAAWRCGSGMACVSRWGKGRGMGGRCGWLVNEMASIT